MEAPHLMSRILMLIVAFFLPPVAIALLRGFGTHFWLNIVLWILSCGILGIIHAFYVVLTAPDSSFTS